VNVRLVLGFTLAAVSGSLLGGCDTASEDSTSGIGDGPRPEQGHAWVIFGADTVDAEVADSPDEHAQGLMFRERLDAGQGMLFVFEAERTQVFYMRNTYVPLDIAFLDRAQVIVDIQQMAPLTEDLHQSARPAMYALEVPEGWFGEQEVQVGHLARIVFGRP
jgi:uncharacterized membrane protein (UPF0127 family)